MRRRCSSGPFLFSNFSSASPFVSTSSPCKITKRMELKKSILLIRSRIQSCVLSQNLPYRPAPDGSTHYDCGCAVFHGHVRNDRHLPMVSRSLGPASQRTYICVLQCSYPCLLGSRRPNPRSVRERKFALPGLRRC